MREHSLIPALSGHPLTKLVVFLLLELWLVLQLSGSTLIDSEWVRSYVQFVGSIVPVVYRFDRIATNAHEVAFLLAISPILEIPNVVFWVQWLRSDQIRIYRYFVVAPTSQTVPSGPFDFVTDSLRGDSENQSAARVERISRLRAVLISLGTLVLALLMGILWPWIFFGLELEEHRGADIRELAVAQGGWRLWLAWFVYQLNLSAGFLALGYCVLLEYSRWLCAVVKKS